MTHSRNVAALVLGLLCAASAPASAAGDASAAACPGSFIADAHLPPAAYADCLRSALRAGDGPGIATDALYEAWSMLWLRETTHPSDSDVASRKLLMAELDRRGALRPAERRDFFKALLSNNQWDEAVQYHDSAAAPQSVRDLPMPVRAAMPSRPAADEARYWSWSADAKTITEHSADLSKGFHLVITASTGCHYCPTAARDIAEDAPLHRAFTEHALWITRPEGLLDPADNLEWNAAHPGLPMVLVTDVRGWPMPDVWSTPYFYFVVDGQVVKLMKGYVPGRLAEIRAEFNRLGVTVD
jgi:hypothetical protein